MFDGAIRELNAGPLACQYWLLGNFSVNPAAQNLAYINTQACFLEVRRNQGLVCIQTCFRKQIGSCPYNETHARTVTRQYVSDSPSCDTLRPDAGSPDDCHSEVTACMRWKPQDGAPTLIGRCIHL